GREAFLHAELVSRDDSLALFGFASEEERDLFGELVSVSGVGPKVAIAALSGGPARELLRAIATGDAKRFQAVPGIGKRTAERIIVELREKIAASLDEAALVEAAGTEEPRSLAREGLINLGYTPPEAERLPDRAEGRDRRGAGQRRASARARGRAGWLLAPVRVRRQRRALLREAEDQVQADLIRRPMRRVGRHPGAGPESVAMSLRAI